jgi:zinc transporter ZupT
MQSDLIVILAAAAVASSLGGLLLCLRAWSEEALYAMISVGGGLLLAITLLDLLPHTLEGGNERVMPFVMLGFALLFALELIGQSGRKTGSPSLIGVLSGFLLHAYVEGVSLVASFRLDSGVGFSVLLAMVLHKVPDGVTVASLVLAATRSQQKAFWGTAALGAATLAGAFSVGVVERFVPYGWSPVVVAVTTGVFLYVSASHLVPLILNGRRVQLGVYFFAGMLAYLLMTAVWHQGGHVHA